MKPWKLLLIIALPWTVPGCGSDDSGTVADPDVTSDSSSDSNLAPSNLVMPFTVADLRLSDGLISPFGVVRSAKDLSEFGHSGIDIPLNVDSDIYAVADGKIIIADAATGGLPGTNVTLVLDQQNTDGVGWVFLYEHINLISGVELNSLVTKGEQIATANGADAGGLHLQLSYRTIEGNYQNHTCWPEQLESSVKTEFQNQFETDIRKRPDFISAWATASESDGTLPYAGLLDNATYPDGAQLCYPQGTDVR